MYFCRIARLLEGLAEQIMGHSVKNAIALVSESVGHSGQFDLICQLSLFDLNVMASGLLEVTRQDSRDAKRKKRKISRSTCLYNGARYEHAASSPKLPQDSIKENGYPLLVSRRGLRSH